MPSTAFQAIPPTPRRSRLSAAILATFPVTLEVSFLASLPKFLGEIGSLDHSSEPICAQQITTHSSGQSLGLLRPTALAARIPAWGERG